VYEKKRETERREREEEKDSGRESGEGRKGKHGHVYFSKLPTAETTGIQDFSREFGPLAAERAARFYSRVVELVDTIAVLFFFSFQAFLSAIPSVPIFPLFYIASYAECMNPIFVKVTRETNAVNRRKAMADLRVSQRETRER